MKANAILLMLIAVLLAGVCVASENDVQTAAAQQAATSWLALTDSGSYSQSWDQAAQVFKDAVTKEEWAQALSTVRARLGKVVSRKLKSATYTTSIPGEPDGQYVVIQYETSFENKATATETVTPTMEKDGQWRVSGYYIH
jgi:Ethanolamine utilization protein EutJ (predicted chaperonin)